MCYYVDGVILHLYILNIQKEYFMQNTVVQSQPLPNIQQVPPFSPNDEECLAEVAKILKKHSCLERFGINLLHQHFPVGDDEVLLETNDPKTRTLKMSVINLSELSNADVRVTSWRLDTGKPQMACVCVVSGDDHGHYSRG